MLIQQVYPGHSRGGLAADGLSLFHSAVLGRSNFHLVLGIAYVFPFSLSKLTADVQAQTIAFMCTLRGYESCHAFVFERTCSITCRIRES